MSLAKNEGKVFYATADKHECNGGSFALGLRMSPALKTGKSHFKLGKFASVTSSKRTMDSVPHLPIGETYAIMYAPLKKTPSTPQVIVIITNPWAMVGLRNLRYSSLGGEHVPSLWYPVGMLGRSPQTYLTGKPNFSLGCDGSKTFSGIVEDEMVMGFPAEMLPEIVGAVKIITEAPGASKT